MELWVPTNTLRLSKLPQMIGAVVNLTGYYIIGWYPSH